MRVLWYRHLDDKRSFENCCPQSLAPEPDAGDFCQCWALDSGLTEVIQKVIGGHMLVPKCSISSS